MILAMINQFPVSHVVKEQIYFKMKVNTVLIAGRITPTLPLPAKLND